MTATRRHSNRETRCALGLGFYNEPRKVCETLLEMTSPFAPVTMAREFKLPDIGEGVHEGEVVKWFVKPGDAVKENDPVVEVMTDKVTVQIPSPVTGKILQLRAKEGEVVKVGSTLVVFGEAGEAVPIRPAAP